VAAARYGATNCGWGASLGVGQGNHVHHMTPSRHEPVIAMVPFDIRDFSTSTDRWTTSSVPKFAALCTIKRAPLWLVGAWVSVPLTRNAQAKAKIRKSLLAQLCLEFIIQVRSRTSFLPTTFICPSCNFLMAGCRP